MHNPKLIPKTHSYKIKLGQIPLTHFKDYRKSISVKLIKWDDSLSMLDGTYQFVKATWADSTKENENQTKDVQTLALEAMLSGKALGLGLETVNFIFKISGITRVDTHQIVRQRIGCTFSQQCTGDRFLTHDNVLIEECIAKDKYLLEEVIQSTLIAKNTYAELVDSGISIQAAREILPQNLETFIYMSTNLSTFLFFHQKRIENESQTWSMNEIAQQMANELIKVYPELKPVFEKNKTKFKFQKEASIDRSNSFATNLYIPEENDFDYHDRDFLYDQTKRQMHFTNTPVENQYYWGMYKTSRKKNDEIQKKYTELETLIEKVHMTNIEILETANNLNLEIEHDLSTTI